MRIEVDPEVFRAMHEEQQLYSWSNLMLEVSIEDNTPQAYQLDYSKQHMLIDVG